MRKKKHGDERIAACAELLLPAQEDLRTAADSFGERRPLSLEIGCGKGDFAVGMAKAHPEKNFLAVEKFPDVCCVALEKAMADKENRPADNLRFFIGDAAFLGDFLPEHSVETIYLNFSDPWPKKAHAKRRLTYRKFLEIYRRLLVEGGKIRLKTDNAGLYAFSKEEFAAMGMTVYFDTEDLHNSPEAEGNVMTEYERNFTEKGQNIFCMIVGF